MLYTSRKIVIGEILYKKLGEILSLLLASGLFQHEFLNYFKHFFPI